MKLQETTFNLLSQVTELWQHEVKKELKEYKLSVTEFMVLSSIVHLIQTKNEITQTDVSTYTQIKPMNMSILLSKLQTKKYLQRKKHSVDTRAKTILLTPVGKDAVAKLSIQINEMSVQFFKIPQNQELEFTTKILAIRDSKLS